MRALLAVLLIFASGCTDGDGGPGEPGVSMSVERNNNNGVQQVKAVLTGIQGPIDDWSDLKVTGCQAPNQGAIDVPHTFIGCGWDIRVQYAATGQTLYST